MRTLAAILFSALLVFLVACEPVGTRELHEVVLLEAEGGTVLRYVYGSAATLPLDGVERELGGLAGESATAVPYGVAAARSVDGEPLLIERVAGASDPPIDPPVDVARIPLTSDLRVVTRTAFSRSYYFDGSRWFELRRDLAAGVNVTSAPKPVAAPLRGAASLTPAEADALVRTLAEARQPLVVAVPSDAEYVRGLAEGLGPSAPEGLDEYRHSVLYVQRGLPTDASAYRPAPSRLVFERVAIGGQGVPPRSDSFVLIRNQDQLRSFWNAVQANSLTPDPMPEARFGRETLLGIRLTERPSGGYAIAVDRVTRENDELFVDLRLIEPAAGAVTTSVITTPWLLVRVLGVDPSVVWFRDPDAGTLFAVARTDDFR